MGGLWQNTLGFPHINSLVMTDISIEHGPVEIVSFPIDAGGSFDIYVLVFP